MRGEIPGLESPVPLSGLMPSIYQEDHFSCQLLGGLDSVLAPIFASLDCLESYVDPALTPEDFLEWLAQWVGVVLQEDSSVDRKRALIAKAVDVFCLRGTVSGLREELVLHTGGEVAINESGGVAWSQTPGAALPGEPVPRLAVRVTVDEGSAIRKSWIEEIVAASTPAHVIYQVELVTRGGGGQ